MPALCSVPACGNPARAHGICTGHIRQGERGDTLGPLRPRGSSGRVPFTVRVSPATKRQGKANPAGARDALERWAVTPARGS